MNIYIEHSDKPDNWANDSKSYKTSSVFVSPSWIESAKDITKIPIYIYFLDGKSRVGKICGLKIHYKYLQKSYLFFFSGPQLISNDDVLINACFLKLYEFAKVNRFLRVQIRSYDYNYNFKTVSHEFYLSNRTEYVVDLLNLTESGNFKFTKKFLYNVRKALKNNPQVIEKNDEASLDTLITLMEETKKKRVQMGHDDYNLFYLPFINKIKLLNLLKAGCAKIFLVTTNNKVNCAQFNMVCEGRVYALYIGLNNLGYQQSLTSYLDYYLINLFWSEGYISYNLGGIPDKEKTKGLISYKNSVGAIEVELSGANTNFLIPPFTLLNPLLRIIRSSPNIITFVNKCKRLFQIC